MTIAGLPAPAPRRISRIGTPPVAAPATPAPLPVERNESAFLTFALYAYLTIYVFEGPFRLLLNTIGLDAAIFLRDALVLGGVLHVIVKQLMVGKVDKFMLVFFVLLTFHGVIGAANLHQVSPVMAAVKVFLSVTIGAFCASRLLASDVKLTRWLLVLWTIGFVAAGVEKYWVDWPWTGMKVEIGGESVEVSRDWQVGAENKRAAGFARSSIHLASFMSVIGLVLLYSVRSLAARLIITTVSLVTIYWTTQKGALVAILLVYVVSFVPERARMKSLKWLLLLFVVLMIAMPLILPGYRMPAGEQGVFSLQSFYDRIQRMWPDAWVWLEQRGTPLFGVGLGGIGVPMRLYSQDAAFYAPDFSSYAPYLINSADNMYVYLYVQFGILTYFYIAYILFYVARIPNEYDSIAAKALAVLTFLVGYGIATSVIEDQISCIMLGATCYYLCCVSSQATREVRLKAKTPTPRAGARSKPNTAGARPR